MRLLLPRKDFLINLTAGLLAQGILLTVPSRLPHSNPLPVGEGEYYQWIATAFAPFTVAGQLRISTGFP